MSDTIAPTCEQLSESWRTDDFASADRVADDSWRHGSRVTEVFHRVADDTYWKAYYRLSTCGETDELRDGDASICQVWPKEIVTTTYTTERPEGE